MSNTGSKISELDEAIELADQDEFVVVKKGEPNVSNRITLENLRNSLGGSGLSIDNMLYVEHTSEGNGGDFISGAWRTRPLNNVVINNIEGASLDNDTITLPAGEYWIEAEGQANGVGRAASRFQKVSPSALTVVKGRPIFMGTVPNGVEVSAGAIHSLAVISDGTLWAWGSNSSGRTGLGIGTSSTFVPTQIGTASNWQSVSAGGSHSLAVRADGTLWAWGANTNGQLGDNTTTQRLVPTQIGTATNWQSVSAGGSHSLAVRADGTLWAWGSNNDGQLGDNTTTQRLVPTQIVGATNWQSVSAGGSHSLAVRLDGTLWAWGSNTSGQLGDNTTTQRLVPTQIVGATNWQSVSAGGSHSLAVRADGTLWAWGSNTSGQLGDNTTTQRLVPTQIGTATNWQSVSAGHSHSLAVRADGTLWAWGSNADGRTGLGTSTGNRIFPTQIVGATNWQSVSAGGDSTSGGHSLAARSDGRLWTWGANSTGQLGDGTSTQRTSPTLIIIFSPSSTSGSLKLVGYFTISEDSAFQFQKYSSFSFLSIGMGIDAKFTPLSDYGNIYATVKIHKVA